MSTPPSEQRRTLWQVILDGDHVEEILDLVPKLDPQPREALHTECVETLGRLGGAGLGSIPLERVTMWAENLRLLALATLPMGDEDRAEEVEDAYDQVLDVVEDAKELRESQARKRQAQQRRRGGLRPLDEVREQFGAEDDRVSDALARVLGLS